MTPHVPPFRRRSRQNIPSHPEHPPGEHSPVHAPIPGLGLRSIKTALATVLTALLYAFFPNSNPTFACIGAIFGMGADMEDSRRSGGNRFFGTIIGGFIGLGLYWLEHLIYPEGNYWLRLPLISLGVVAMISICVLFHWPGGVQPGGVGLCIIDLDTVMPGLAMNDFGDSIRFGASTAAEDEKDLSKVSCSMDLFDLYAKGFIEGCAGRLTSKEIELLPMGAKVMTFECGMRFLTDYLQGDRYFKIHREGHNLDRCRTQFKLVADMETKWETMQGIVKKYQGIG